MRLSYLVLLVAGANANSYCPFPTCAECLPSSVYDMPGLGFGLSFSSVTAAAHLRNGTIIDAALINATSDYAALMARLVNSPVPPPLSKWAKLRRSMNKKLGWPATPDVGTLADMLVSLRDAAAAALVFTGLPERVVVTHPPIPGLAEYDVRDAIEHIGLRSWLAPDLPRPKLSFPLPSAGAYPTELTEAHAVMAAHGQGLCENFKNLWACEEEERHMALETLMIVGLGPADLRAEIIRTRTPFSLLQFERVTQRLVDLGAGLDARGDFGSDDAFWHHIRNQLQTLLQNLPLQLTGVFLAGENSTHPAFLGTLWEALKSSGYVLSNNDESKTDLTGPATFHGLVSLTFRRGGRDAEERLLVGEATDRDGGMIDPAFASARGAAQYGRWRQEAPIGCKEKDECQDERRKRNGHSHKDREQGEL